MRTQPSSNRPAANELPIIGTAAASLAGALAISSDPVDWVRRPVGIARAKDVYGLFVRGQSMIPRYHPGELIFVHPHKPINKGDCCIVQTNAGGEHNAWLKEFDRQTDKHLVVKQYNPMSEIKFTINTVTSTHKVLTTAELIGI